MTQKVNTRGVITEGSPENHHTGISDGKLAGMRGKMNVETEDTGKVLNQHAQGNT